MERNRKLKVLGIVALVLGLIGLTIAFAAMSRVLKINGTGNVDRANWDIHFRNVTFLSKSATASISGDPEPSNTNKGVTITGLNVTLKQPGDYVKYTADIKNEGDIDAAIKLVTPPSLTERQNSLFEFTAEYTDVQAKGSKVIEDGDILRVGDIKNITITFKYKDEVVASQLPTTPEAIELTYSILYEQLFEETTTSQQQGGVTPSKPVVKQLDVSKGENDSVTAYFYDDDTISIEGTGEITSDLEDSLKFEGDENPYNATSITLGEGITNVPSGIYTANEDITDVNLPSTITKIENNAFEGCTGLTSIELPSSVTEIGDEAFKNCTNLETITVGDSSSTQGVALKNMANLGASNIISIGASAFYNCTSLTNVDNLISGLTTISDNMLYNCTGLTRLTIPVSVTSLGANSFYNCTGLTYLSVPGTVSLSGMFTNVSNLQELTITGSGSMADYTSITSRSTPLYISRSNIRTITINEGITRIGDYAFADIPTLKSVTIPSSVTSIGDFAFSSTKLTSVTIPSSVTSIGDYAFADIPTLKSVTIPSSVTSIGASAFQNCTSLTSVVIPSSVTSIGYYVFGGCTGLTGLTISNGVTSILQSAFSNCTGLTSVIIPNSVTSLSGFSGCTGLTSVTIPSSVTSIGSNAFSSTKLTSVTIPSSVTSIGASAFQNCTSLTSVVIPSSVTSIGASAFSGCTGLTTLTIPGTAAIATNAFTRVTNIEEVTITGNGSMVDYTFKTYRCTPWYISKDKLKKITIGENLTSIGNYTFKGCTGLTNITIPNNITNIGQNAFDSWTAEQTINIDNTSSYVSSNWNSSWNTNSSAVVNYLRD